MNRLAVVLALALAACGAKHRGEPLGPPVQPDTIAESRGQELFFTWCYQCHPGGGAGLGPALNDKPLPEIAIRTQIRNGVGAMPSFGPELLDDDDVARIAKYVQEMRGTSPTFPQPPEGTELKHARR